MRGVGGVRDVEALRSKLSGWVGKGGGRYLACDCAGGKCSSQYDMMPFTFPVPPAGFTPFFESTLTAWADRRTGMAWFKPYFFRKFRRTADGFAWSGDESAPPEQIVEMWYILLERLGLDRVLCARIRLTPYATRHILPDVTRRQGWPLEKRMSLGRWSIDAIRELLLLLAQGNASASGGVRKRMRSAASACANIYSRGSAALSKEAELRREATALVSAFIGDKPWRDVVPIQREKPTFDFLVGTPASDGDGDVELGVSDADDASDDDTGGP